MNPEAEEKSEVSNSSPNMTVHQREFTFSNTPPSDPHEITAPDRLIAIRDRAIVLFMLDTRLRASELVLLDLNKISFITREFPDGSVETTASGCIPGVKSDKRREFVLSARTVEAFSLYLRSTRRGCADPVLCGGVMRLGFLSKLLTECWYRLGSQRLMLHEFRRRIVLRLFNKGGGLLAIGRALGCARKSPAHEVLPPPDPQSS
jgi:integrase